VRRAITPRRSKIPGDPGFVGARRAYGLAVAAPERGAEVAAYLAERYWPGLDRLKAEHVMSRLVAHADADASTRMLACAFVPGEQAILVLVSADSSGKVTDLGRRADVAFDRVVEAVVPMSDAPREASRR
jgi:hypothetical protein